MNIKFKVCGIRSESEINHINSVNADYVGFIFSESKRKITKERCQTLIKNLKKDIKKVAVFKNENIEFIREIVESCNIDVVQLHGNEDIDFIRTINGVEIWKTLDGDSKNLAEMVKAYKPFVNRILLDSKTAGHGIAFNWENLKEFSNGELVVAGGLSSNNIEKLLKYNEPYAVDLSSSLEDEYGKNLEKILELKETMLKINKENRVKVKLVNIKRNKKKGFIGFLPLSYPNEKDMISTVLELERLGMDMIEIGFGGVNPYMDGEIIKNAYESIKRNNIFIEDIFKVIKSIRKVSEIPIVLMTYRAEIVNKNKSFFEKFKEVGGDALIIPDMRVNDEKKFLEQDLMIIPVINTVDIEHAKIANAHKDGFIYCISRNGKTGEGKIDFKTLEKKIDLIRKSYNGDIFLGFGMGNYRNIVKTKRYIDGVIIGTDIIKKLNLNKLNSYIVDICNFLKI